MSAEKIIGKISESKKYKGLYKKVIARIVQNCLKKYPEKEVEKRARNLLHQIWGAYFPGQLGFEKLWQNFERDYKTGKEIKEVVLPILKLQSSIKERIEILNDFYQKIFSVTGQPKSIVDWACGLNPLAWPWMNLPKESHYLGLDIDKNQRDFLNKAFKLTGQNNFKAELGDILADDFPKADVVFLLKILPLLEHQQKGVSLEILKKMPSHFLVVSFPTQSVSGQKKGMVDFYTKQFQDLTKESGWQITKLLFPTELVFIVQK